MRSLILSFVLLAGCGGTTGNPDGAGIVIDMAKTGSSNADLAGGGSGGADMTLLPLASLCTANTQCASGTCAPYKMGAYSLCTYACTKGSPAPMCTSPGNMTCNGMGYCMFPGM